MGPLGAAASCSGPGPCSGPGSGLGPESGPGLGSGPEQHSRPQTAKWASYPRGARAAQALAAALGSTVGLGQRTDLALAAALGSTVGRGQRSGPWQRRTQARKEAQISEPSEASEPSRCNLSIDFRVFGGGIQGGVQGGFDLISGQFYCDFPVRFCIETGSQGLCVTNRGVDYLLLGTSPVVCGV